jgi:hypothetical protein
VSPVQFRLLPPLLTLDFIEGFLFSAAGREITKSGHFNSVMSLETLQESLKANNASSRSKKNHGQTTKQACKPVAQAENHGKPHAGRSQETI